ncbi:MAG: hypothetical protein IPG98_10015 [Burkholderiales bacterium]|nr:hypothetical protein [Burkholderiales bacterium]
MLIMAVCLGGAAFGLRKLTRGKVPKWLIPASAAAGMFGYLAYYDYSWHAFKLSQLPAGTTVIAEKRETSFLKPWRYVYPAVSAFTILDGKFSSRLQDHQVLVEYIEYTFRADPIEGLDTQAFVLNCNTLERVPFDPGKHQISGAVEKIEAHDAIYRKACR